MSLNVVYFRLAYAQSGSILNYGTAFLLADFTYYILSHLVIYMRSLLFTEHNVLP